LSEGMSMVGNFMKQVKGKKDFTRCGVYVQRAYLGHRTSGRGSVPHGHTPKELLTGYQTSTALRE